MSLETGSTPYVISNDVAGLMTRWTQAEGLEMPRNGLLPALSSELQQTLSGYFAGGVEVIDEQEIHTGLQSLMAASAHPIVSLDRAYVGKDTPNLAGYIEVTRGVNDKLEDIGVRPRPGQPSKEEQLQRLWTPDIQPVTLVDDVLFTGGSIVNLADDLVRVNRPVRTVIAGIGIQGGIDNVEQNGIEVVTVRTYPDVVDEVCARDFRPGVPMSGRSVYSAEGRHSSAPYVAPFGNPERWATIPRQRVPEFSELCLDQAITLWSAVENASGTKIPTDRIPRQIRGVEANSSIVSALKRHRT